MPSAYSVDLREKVVHAYRSGGGTIEQIANLFNIGERTLRNYLYREKQLGHLHRSPCPGRPSVIKEHHRDYLTQRLLDDPSLRLLDLCDELKTEYKLIVSEGWMCKILKSIGFRRKKKQYLPTEQLDKNLKKKRGLLSNNRRAAP